MWKKIVILMGVLANVSFANQLDYIDTKQWMKQLSGYIYERSIGQVYLPGSHDSATYKLEHKFGKNQDMTSKLNALRFIGVGYAVTTIAYKWSQAQNRSIAQQLEDGVRYLDLRVIYRDSKKQFYTVHGLYGPSLDDVLGQIVRFLSQNPTEIIVIQVGDLRYMPHGPKDHQELISKLRRAFNTRLVTNDEVDAPLSELWKNKRQVLLIYKNQQISKQYSDVFDPSVIADYWANAQNLRDLKARLDTELRNKKLNGSPLYVIQSQLTPTDETIKNGLNPFYRNYRSLQDMAMPVKPYLSNWLKDWSHAGGSIVLLDFINRNDCDKIIRRNLP